MLDTKVKVAVCDDEDYMRKQLCQVLEKKFENRNIDIDLEVFDLGRKLLESKTEYDLMFLDIEMPELDGLEVARKLREDGKEEIAIVFLTSHIEDARRAYQVKAHRFLVKDSYEEEIDECLDSFLKGKKTVVKHKVNSNGTLVDVSETDILYITSRHNGTEVWLDKSVCTSEKSLSEWADVLDGELFARVHSSYIVNISQIDYIDENIVLYSGERISFSRRKKSEIKQRFAQYMCSRVK